MGRHRGKYNPENEEPYELSRSKIEDFLACPACFYLEKVKGVPFPSGIPFSLNEATDVLFKRDFDRLREKKQTHPYLEKIGYSNLIPFEHPELGKWQDSLHFGAEGRLNTVHESTHLKIGGGLDDVFMNTKTNQLHIVDYKSTSQKTEGRQITLDGLWRAGIKRQMDVYVWILRRKGFDVSDIGFFLYCDGDRFTDYTFLSEEIANMQFKITWLPYKVNLSWIEPCLEKIKECILQPECPVHSEGCEYEAFLKAVKYDG